MSDKKKKEDILRETLLNNPKNGFDRLETSELDAMEQFSRAYREFLDLGKTERDCVTASMELAEKSGFVPYTRGMTLRAGDRVYVNNRGKAIVLAVIGSAPLCQGAHIVAAHIDSPRLDLRTNPLYEDSGLAYFKTHYYGGIKKYQWPTLPLELRGVVALKDGTVVHVETGSGKDDPVLYISDLLPHLASDQYKKTLSEAFPGESLNVLLGSRPLAGDEGADRTKLAIMQLLNDKYGIVEADLQSAELSLVPAFNARDVGLDRSMIGAYGQDDRVCAYTALRALLEAKKPRATAICALLDKEEVGSDGVSGMQSAFFDGFLEDLCAAQGTELRVCAEKSFCVSADVCAAYDPNFPEVSDKRNNAALNFGLGITKYTGSRGKAGASDASAELIARLRRVFDEANVLWQMAPMGKVDQGGGGTVAIYMANRNIDTIDAGVPLMSMHAPFEVVSKLDTYMAFKGFKAVYED